MFTVSGYGVFLNLSVPIRICPETSQVIRSHRTGGNQKH